MHILVLSWDVERPGWLDPAVHGLARALGRAGASCEVVTLGTGPTATAPVDGVEVTWAAEAPPVLPPTPDYDVARVLASTTRTSAAAERRCQQRTPDVVLAIGWQTAWTATTLRASRGTPLVAWLDSTAPSRADGDLDAHGRLAAQVEWWLTYEARRVVTSSDHVGREVRRTYRLPGGKVEVVPPGVEVPGAPTATDDGVVVVAPDPVVTAVQRAVPGTTVTTDPGHVGTTGLAVVLEDDAPALVLHAMAAGAAVVVPDDGPLRGLVHARRSGVRVDRHPDAAADSVAALVAAPERARRLGERARDRVRARHDWGDVAERHLAVAHRAVAEEAELRASSRPRRPLRPMLLRSPLLGLVGEDTPVRTNGPHEAGEQG